MRGLRLAALSFLVLSLFSPLARAAPLLASEQLAGAVPEVWVLEDPGGKLRFEDVASESARFEQRPSGLNVGYSPVTFWIRFEVTNPSAERSQLVVQLFRAADFIDFYELSSGKLRHVATGSRRPFGSRELAHADFVFRTRLEPGTTTRYFARLASQDSFELTPRVWAAPEFVEQLRTATLASGLYYGVMLALILYNAFVLFATRASAYGAYVGYQLCYTALIGAFDRYTFQYLWPNSPDWAARSEVVFGSAALAFGAWFARSFLEVPRHLPRFTRVLDVIAGGGVLLALVGTVSASSAVQQVTFYFAVTALFPIIGAGVIGWARGIPNARYYVVAYVCFTVGMVVDTLATTGLVPRPGLGAVYLRLGAASEALLLAFALANRINLERRARERATSELAESRRQYAATLEQRVDERTHELSRALAHLESAHVELARRERLASLGRLVAGVAHEVNNPLTFAAGGAAKLRQELGRVAEFVRRLGKQSPPAGDEVDRASAACATAESALGLVDAGNQRIGAIVSNLRAYVTSGQSEPVPVDVAEELRATLGFSAHRLEQAKVRLVDQSGPLPKCACRPGELGQVFMNLVMNACQAMPEGGTLTVATGSDADTLWVRFADSGAGVPAELRERIFEPFFTTRAPGGGTGLGLSVSHEIVTRSGGELRLLPSDGGALFEVRLPRAAGPPASA